MTGKSGNKAKKQVPGEDAGQAGWEALQAGDFSRAEKLYLQALKKARRLADEAATAVFLSYLAIARAGLGKAEQCRAALEESVQRSSLLGLDKIRAYASLLLGEQWCEVGDRERAIQYFLQALDASLSCQDEVGVEAAFGNLGLIYLERGWAEQASECFSQALERTPDSVNRAVWLGSLGQCLSELGKYDEALEYYRQAGASAAADGDLTAHATACGSAGNAHFEKGEDLSIVLCQRVSPICNYPLTFN